MRRPIDDGETCHPRD